MTLQQCEYIRHFGPMRHFFLKNNANTATVQLSPTDDEERLQQGVPYRLETHMPTYNFKIVGP